MKNKIAAVVLTLAMLVPATSYAAGSYRSNNTTSTIGSTKVYLGVKYGVLTIEPDTSGADNIETDNLGFMFGGHINDYMSLEFDYTQTVSAGQEDFLGSVTKVKTDTTGLFLVARTVGTVYFKGRVGYSWIDQSVSGSGSDRIYGLAYGAGVGFELGDTFAIEGEYTMYPKTEEFDRFGGAGDLDTSFLSVNAVWSYN
jgi:opacity protein-like surface antigen